MRTVAITDTEVVLSGTNAVKPGDAVSCEFVNKPIPNATIRVSKTLQDVNGANLGNGNGWQLGAATTAVPTGSITPTPAAAAQTTTETGFVDWTLAFDTTTDRASVVVSETQQIGYEFVSGSCTVTPSNGDPTTVAISSADGVTLDGVKPGDAVVCGFVNKQQAGTVTWQKVDDSRPAQHLANSEWKIVGPSPATTVLAVADCVATDAAGCANQTDKDHRAGHFSVTGLAWGSYQLIETKAPAGYRLTDTPYPFAISATALAVPVEGSPFTNVRRDGPVIPLTGGIGRDAFFIAGLLIIAAGFGAVGVKRVRSRREGVA